MNLATCIFATCGIIGDVPILKSVLKIPPMLPKILCRFTQIKMQFSFPRNIEIFQSGKIQTKGILCF